MMNMNWKGTLRSFFTPKTQAHAVFDGTIDRTDAQVLMPEDVQREILQSAPEQSAVLRLARRLPNMSRIQRRIPVLSALPIAYFVDGDTGLKQTTRMAWDNKFINAEELAVIVPMPIAVLNDADYDIWAESRPHIEAAFGAAIDAAILHGTNAPASWPTDVVAAATAAGNTVAEDFGDDLYDAIMDVGGVIAKVEEDGYMPSGHIAALNLRAKLRGLRTTDGQPLFVTSMQGTAQYALDGDPIIFPRNGALDTAVVSMITGDWTQLVYAIRQDVSVDVATQAVIQDANGDIIYNLFQQDMVAMRFVFRLGWQVPNPITQLHPDPNDATRYPFALLTPVL